MESMINGYIAHGFIVANRTPTSVTLSKRKEFSVLWAVIGFIKTEGENHEVFSCVDESPFLIRAFPYSDESPLDSHSR